MGVSHHGVRGLVAELTGEMKYKLNCFVLQLAAPLLPLLHANS
jgi:hypothetical protein